MGKRTEYKAKGYITFAYTPKGLVFNKITKNELINQRTCWITDRTTESAKEIIQNAKNSFDELLTFPIYDLMSGLTFLKCVRNGDFIAYDGNISNIFVDGYVSNIGLACGDIRQGEFMLDGDAFEIFCREHKVEVNWANR